MSDSERMNSHHIQPTPTSPAPTPAPDTAYDGAQLDADQFDAAAALLRLLVGGTLVGADELRDRLERWREAPPSAAPLAPPPRTTPASLDTLRYAFVGMLFETETRMRRRFSTALTYLSRVADEANLFYTRRMLDLRETPLDLARMRLDELLFQVMVTVDRWTDRGWLEEQQGRRMARQATTDVIDELLDYMARNPEVRKLIEQQGLGMAESAVDEVRERTATADMWIEQLAHRLLRRSNSAALAKPTDTAVAPPSATQPPAPPVKPPATPTARPSVPSIPAAQAKSRGTPAPPAAGMDEMEGSRPNDARG